MFTRSLAFTLALAVLAAVGCASNPPQRAPSSPISAAVIEARLAEADALAARGCYLCLREASDAYNKLISVSDTPTVIRHALENDLMIAIRETELRLPDSGARARAQAQIAVWLKPDTTEATANYDAYFDVLDVIDKPLVMGGVRLADFRQREAERKALADRLETNWPSSAMAAYFYVATTINAGQIAALKPHVSAILETHNQSLAVKYRFQAYSPTFTSAAAAELLAQEPRFSEVHYLLGQRAVFGAALVKAHEELSAAHDGLPDSLTIALSFGTLELAFGRYARALQLFDQVLARGPDEAAGLGRAVALSYLKRHHDAIMVLDDLLRDASSNPGDKYYWRGWNHLALTESQLAYDDAKAAMNAMANSDVFKLAGMASYNLARAGEARGYFESSLKMNAAECDSSRYLGLIDVAERSWLSAVTRFTSAASCYRTAVETMEGELAKKQADTSGLYAGQIDGILADIAEAKALLNQSSQNAVVAARNAAPPPAASPVPAARRP